MCLPAAGSADVLRVGTSGDYAPFSLAGPRGLTGFDIDVARAYAEDRGLSLEFVRFAWPELLEALAEGRFDVAMSGVTLRTERSIAGRFSVPLLETGAVVLVREPTTASSPHELDQRGTRVGVNAGGHLEQVARRQFRLATLVAIADNAGVLGALARGSVDAVVTDSVEAPAWQATVEDVRRFGPLTRDRKAYLVYAEHGDLARDLDTWLLEREADGALAELRTRHFGRNAGEPTATPLAALVAAMDERLALMPSVAAAKRANARPIAAPARERKVLDATVTAVREVAEATGRPAPREAAIRAFTRAQMDAAKEVQMAAVRDPDFAPPATLPDLDDELRPALLRIGEHIAALVVALPTQLAPHSVDAACRDGLRAAWLHEEVRARLCAALRELSLAPRGEAEPEPVPEPSNASGDGATTRRPPLDSDAEAPGEERLATGPTHAAR
ncbi:MAG: transporter substrate-binding domain-containing protein [Deltaproteobacteria bacterium]|nr:transporter substrate-binding domain-containing protein [Deltaproteobacteria bacterium]MBW2359513.1 transporter substrate-binding domain-containing protein [Deltaproteobacteria bacterium]